MRLTAAEKHEIIRLVEGSDLSVRRTLRELGVHRSTFYAWYRRYQAVGAAGLVPRPVRRAIAAQAAAVQCRRDQARTVRVGELSVGRAGQADPGSQVDGFSCGRSGEQPPVAGL